MAEDRTDPGLFWLDPDERGIIPLVGFHVPRKLRKTILAQPYDVRFDTSFRAVMQACAQPAEGRDNTWISERIEALYCNLHTRGFAHSVECWHEGALVGGLYGVAIGGAFFGESMFHTATDASKIALTYLVARLRYGGFQLLDTQFITTHLMQFGALEIPRSEYHSRLEAALLSEADFQKLPFSASPAEVLHCITQTS